MSPARPRPIKGKDHAFSSPAPPQLPKVCLLVTDTGISLPLQITVVKEQIHSMCQLVSLGSPSIKTELLYKKFYFLIIMN